MYSIYLLVLLPVLAWGQVTDSEIMSTTHDVWEAAKAEGTFFTDEELQYDIEGSTGKLFLSVDDDKLSNGTYGLLTALYQDYDPFTGTADFCSSECLTRRDAFLDGMVNSSAINLAFDMLQNHDVGLITPAGRRAYLYDIWFAPYTRSGLALDSSGFEHVFMGEIDDGVTKGYHGWPKAYLDERNGYMVYGSRVSPGLCVPDITKFSMDYMGYTVAQSTTYMFMKTPPEVEMAIYTICFFSRPNEVCRVSINQGWTVPIETFRRDCTNDAGKLCVGFAYPDCHD